MQPGGRVDEIFAFLTVDFLKTYNKLTDLLKIGFFR